MSYQMPGQQIGYNPVINMSGGQAEFWRVLNASINGFLALQVNSGGAQQLRFALDGIPVATSYYTTIIYLPPAGRAEFIVRRSRQGCTPISPHSDRSNHRDSAAKPSAPNSKMAQRFAGLASVTPNVTRCSSFRRRT